MLILFFFTPVFDGAKTYFQQVFYDYTARYGFVLRNVTVEGNKNTLLQEVVDAIGYDKGDALFAIKIDEVKRRLEEHPWVKHAIVERIWPSSLYVAIIEREAISIWQFQNKLYLIDDDGDKIALYTPNFKGCVFYVIGQDANIYVKTLLEEMRACPEVDNRIVSATRYGRRRWNLNFDEGFVVKMPEKGFAEAYQRLCRFNQSGQLFNQNYEMIDLRDEQKMYFKKR